jgi:phage-related holin
MWYQITFEKMFFKKKWKEIMVFYKIQLVWQIFFLILQTNGAKCKKVCFYILRHCFEIWEKLQTP